MPTASAPSPAARPFALGCLKRLFLVTVVLAAVVSLSVVTYAYAPPAATYRDGDWDETRFRPSYEATGLHVLVDQHSHTLYSDGALTPLQNLQWHVAMGFNACVVTDHVNGIYPDPWEGAIEARRLARSQLNDTIKVLVGIEWTTNRVHMNFIFPPAVDPAVAREQVPFYGRQPTDAQIQAAIDAVHALGGLVTVNHWLWSLPRMPTHPSRAQFYAWGVDYFEIINEDVYDQESYEFCRARADLGVITGSDMHTPDGNPVGGWTIVHVPAFTEEAIFAELAALRTDIVHLSGGAPYEVAHEPSPGYAALRPLILLGDLFEDYMPGGTTLDWAGIGVLLAYLYGTFTVVELVRYARARRKQGPPGK